MLQEGILLFFFFFYIFYDIFQSFRSITHFALPILHTQTQQ